MCSGVIAALRYAAAGLAAGTSKHPPETLSCVLGVVCIGALAAEGGAWVYTRICM